MKGFITINEDKPASALRRHGCSVETFYGIALASSDGASTEHSGQLTFTGLRPTEAILFDLG